MKENRLFEDYSEILSMKIEYRMSNKKFRMSKYGIASLSVPPAHLNCSDRSIPEGIQPGRLL